MRLAAFAAAKVNLWLRVTGRRADGYHLLDSLVVFADVGDRLEAEAAPTLTLSVDGPFGAALADEAENLVLRAARALAPGRGAALLLDKRLPVASGIGGGSADAAAALHALSALWGLDAAAAARVAPALGADVPVCLHGEPCRMQGAGERLAPVAPLPAIGLVLANPRIALETRAVFAARTGGFSAPFDPPPWPDPAALAHAIRAAGNDLQDAAIALCPKVAEVLAALAALPGARAAAMSGSGATCFAVFDTPALAAAAAEALPAAWWRWGGGLAAPPVSPARPAAG